MSDASSFSIGALDKLTVDDGDLRTFAFFVMDPMERRVAPIRRAQIMARMDLPGSFCLSRRYTDADSAKNGPAYCSLDMAKEGQGEGRVSARGP